MLFINSKQKEKMSEDESNKTSQPLVDLSELSNLQFQTAWTPSSNIGDSTRSSRGKEFKKSFRRKDFSKDAPERRRPRYESKAADGDDSRSNFKKRPFKKFAKGSDKKKPYAPFVFTMDVQIFPEDVPFNKLSEIIKASKRTYQLFDIAELVLEKNDRFVVLAKNLPDESGAVKPLFCAQPLNLPFEDEASAKQAAIDYYTDELFEKQQIEAEPPKGSFQIVNRCSATGDLLGAPNWHKYNENLREYHREHCPKMPFEAFLSTIEAVRDPEQINAWLEQMKKRDVYKLKNPAEGENDIFETREAAANYVAHKMGAELVRTYEQVRMKGANLQKLPFGRIRRNIEEAWHKQKRFPIVTANNLRGRLRRSGFSVYKRGSKGFAFVSVVKRKFLLEGDKLSDTPQKIFDFITANPAILATDLPYKFLELTPPDNQPKAKTLAEENKAEQPEVQASPIAAATELSDEQKQQLNAVWSELLWLVSEGYVVEYADSTLQANPYLPRPKDKSQKPVDAENLGAADEPIVAAKAEETQAEQPAGEAPEQAEAVAEEPAPALEEKPESEEQK